MKRIVLAVAFVTLPGVAFADEEAPAKLSTLILSLDYALGTYADATYTDPAGMTVTETVTQSRYAVGVRLEVYDWRKATPLGAVPGIWFDGQLGYVGGDSFDGERLTADGGEGGLLWDLKMAGPWKLFDTRHLRFGAGIGFRGGIEMGVPKGTDRLKNVFAFDASVMAIADLRFSRMTALIEGEYAVGLGYVEQRAYGHVGFGKLALGATLTVGQAAVNYVVAGLHVGLRFEQVTR